MNQNTLNSLTHQQLKTLVERREISPRADLNPEDRKIWGRYLQSCRTINAAKRVQEASAATVPAKAAETVTVAATRQPVVAPQPSFATLISANAYKGHLRYIAFEALAVDNEANNIANLQKAKNCIEKLIELESAK